MFISFILISIFNQRCKHTPRIHIFSINTPANPQCFSTSSPSVLNFFLLVFVKYLDMALLKLHGAPMSTCTVRVLACLYEKGIEFELVSVNMALGEHKNPAHLAKNPFGQIPALEDGDDLTLFESRAITRYIATKYKEEGTDLLRLDESKESAIVNVWLEVEAHQFGPAIYAIVYQRMVVPVFFGGVPDEGIIETNSEKLGKVLDVYEEKLSKTKYLAGDFFSLADLHHLPYTYYLMKTPEAKLIESRSHVKSWWDDISSRPAFLKVAEGMKVEPEIASEK